MHRGVERGEARCGCGYGCGCGTVNVMKKLKMDAESRIVLSVQAFSPACWLHLPGEFAGIEQGKERLRSA